MKLLDRIALVLVVGYVVPMIVSYFADGWTTEYTSPKWTLDDIPDLNGKVAIVTGANTGIGKITAQELYRKGSTVIATTRSVDKGQSASRDIYENTKMNKLPKENLVQMLLDLSSMESVSRFVAAFLAKGLKLDILVLNAGVMMSPYGTTKEGLELQFGTNHIGHFLLVKLLMPLIIESKTRIVIVSSAAHKYTYWEGIRFNQLTNDNNYNPLLAYGQSKLANILFGYELADRLKDTGVTVVTLHPGLVKSDLQRHVNDFFSDIPYIKQLYPMTVGVLIDYASLSTEKGAYTQLFAATTPNVTSANPSTAGVYMTPIGVTTTSSAISYNKDLQTNLWKVSNAYTSRYLPEMLE